MTASIADSDSLCEVGVLNLRMLPSARVCVCDVVAVLFPAPAGYPQTRPVKTIQGKATRQIGQSALSSRASRSGQDGSNQGSHCLAGMCGTDCRREGPHAPRFTQHSSERRREIDSSVAFPVAHAETQLKPQPCRAAQTAHEPMMRRNFVG